MRLCALKLLSTFSNRWNRLDHDLPFTVFPLDKSAFQEARELAFFSALFNFSEIFLARGMVSINIMLSLINYNYFKVLKLKPTK